LRVFIGQAYLPAKEVKSLFVRPPDGTLGQTAPCPVPKGLEFRLKRRLRWGKDATRKGRKGKVKRRQVEGS
jgi:hypothetical protein